MFDDVLVGRGSSTQSGGRTTWLILGVLGGLWSICILMMPLWTNGQDSDGSEARVSRCDDSVSSDRSTIQECTLPIDLLAIGLTRIYSEMTDGMLDYIRHNHF